MRVSQAVAYAENAMAFVLSDSELFPLIRSVYLFGSAVREEATKTSDIDLFVDCESKHEKFVKKRVDLGLNKFYRSRDFDKWRLSGIENQITAEAGDLRTWQLKKSIESEGLVVYARSVQGIEYARKVIIVLELPKKKTSYLKLIRSLFGRPEYKSPGLVTSIAGEKIAANTFIIPQAGLPKITKTLNGQKIRYKLIEFLTPEE